MSFRAWRGISCILHLWAIPCVWQTWNSASNAEWHRFDEYTSPQQFIDSDNPAIITLVSTLRGETDYQTAQNIHNHVYRLISWPQGERINVVPLYASELLEERVGVCRDFAYLMTALLRAEGIPARPISGLALNLFGLLGSNANDWSHAGASHSWVEFFADDSWHFADPSWGIFGRTATEHLSFGTYNADFNSNFWLNQINSIENAGYSIIGAMSAPLRFIAYSTDQNAIIIPRGEVSFTLF